MNFTETVIQPYLPYQNPMTQNTKNMIKEERPQISQYGTIAQPMIRGSNNGTFGFGMNRGAVFPPSMNGPFGYQNYPLPNNLEFPNGGDGYSNAREYNGPSYNTASFKSIMGNYATPDGNIIPFPSGPSLDGFNFNNYSNKQASVTENGKVLLIDP